MAIPKYTYVYIYIYIFITKGRKRARIYAPIGPKNIIPKINHNIFPAKKPHAIFNFLSPHPPSLSSPLKYFLFFIFVIMNPSAARICVLCRCAGVSEVVR